MKKSREPMTVGRLAAERPAAAAVLERLGFDYVWQGDQVLDEACQAAGMDVNELLELVAAEEHSQQPTPATGGANLMERSLTELCDHIEQTHHEYLKVQLPRLDTLINWVTEQAEERYEVWDSVRRIFRKMRAELEGNLSSQEWVLFPAIRRLEQHGKRAGFPFARFSEPIGKVKQEHQRVGEAFRELRRLTDQYAVPSDASHSYRELMESLQQCEKNLYEHFHKEHNILFRKTLKIMR
ncbi:MAG: iron-sulfur cluster repair di-iron protein [Pirellulaceae bacterium]|nr:MAG: iron-sulfur cluster repair di-iron protein [Pirellulaceae bacterium]